jgi:alkanesulfonate monooxygenase SsuD/methylene tetrahydromethanopterin reductase-like flavin-dependent oxidoreductase (luciferase family)
MNTPLQRPPIVVVAAIATGVIAARGADVVLHVDEVPERAAAPAMQARNHAASPALPAKP